MRRFYFWASWAIAAVFLAGGTVVGSFVALQRSAVGGQFDAGNIASGAQIILGAAVAAFAIVQATISAQATQAARDAVTSTDRQTAVMRDEAERSERHALAAYQIAREERLDATAPRVSLVCLRAALRWPADTFMEVTERWTLPEQVAMDEALSMQAEWELSNHDSVPVLFDAGLVHGDWIPEGFRPEFLGDSRGMLGPGETMTFVARTGPRPVAAWAAFAKRATEPGQQNVAWLRLRVKVVQATFTVMDIHNAWVRPPRIVREAVGGVTSFRADGQPMEFARLAAIKRSYASERLRALDAIADDWPQ